MKKEPKKAHRNFRLALEIDAELVTRSKETGIPQTRIIEDALRSYFQKTMSKLHGAKLARWPSTMDHAAERRGWMIKNPMKLMERIRIDQKPPKILTVDQAQRMMNFAKYQWPRGLAFLTLAMFAGIRPEELQKITWANVGESTVTVDAAASKVRRRRIVHLPDNAIEWINFARETGAVLPFRLNSRTKMLRKAAPLLGFKNGWPQDILRHTAASMWMADTKDVPAVARELGNSPSILLTHYYELVTAESALAFWSIRP